MPLSKYPIEVPLGGAVDEGNVPEAVQPPRIRAATDCVSIKGGAYSKKDDEEDRVNLSDDTLRIAHTRTATTGFETTAISTYPDDGSVSTSSYPSPVTGRTARSYFPTESDNVKEHGDHATLRLPSGVHRTMCAWNVDPTGDYRIFQDTSTTVGAPFTPAADFTPSLFVASGDNSSAAYNTGAASYAIFDGDIQKGPESAVEALTVAEAALFPPNQPAGTPMAFPRVRADQDSRRFWITCAIPYYLNGIPPIINDDGYGFTLATRVAQTAPPALTSAIRDVFNEQPNISNNYGVDTVTPGGKLLVYNEDGELLAARVTDGAGDPLTPPLDTVFVQGESLYTLHMTLLSAPASGAIVRKWIYNGVAIIPDPLSPEVTIPTGPFSGSWPAGLHDTGTNLMLVWSNTARTPISYDLVPSPTVSLFDFAGEIGVLAFDPRLLSGRAGLFARESQNIPLATQFYTATQRMTRGAWPGSFIAPLQDGTGRVWCGVQYVAGDTFHSGFVIHALIDGATGAVVAGDDGSTSSVSTIPGVIIGSEGCFIPNVGPSVCLYGSCPGDNRTFIGQICSTAAADAPTSTMLLATRREIEAFSGIGGGGPGGGSAKNQAVSICQLQAQSQALGTYINNPFQMRTNMFVRDDRVVSFKCFERSAPLSFVTDSLKDLIDSETRVSGASSRSRPQVASPEPVVTMGTTESGDYALADGAQMVSTAGPQAPAAGWGPQAILDVPVVSGEEPNPAPNAMPLPEGIKVSGVGDGSSPQRGATFTFAGHAAFYDENGGVHRTVPWQSVGTLALTFPAGAVPDQERHNLQVGAYPIPYVLLGLSNSRDALIEVYGSGPDGTTPPVQVGIMRMRPVGIDMWGSAIPTIPLSLQNTLETSPGSQEILYTDSGELAADAPDPSLALAASNSRLWSVSSINPRQAQYTKFLRRGYAPEWNGNLTVRVAGTAEPLTCIGVLPDNRILLFCEHAIYYTYGEGPSDTGQGAGFSEPALLSDSVGCSDKNSVVYGDFGCMFLGDRGFYLVDRALSLTYVGLPYEDSTDAQVFATSLDGLRSEAIFYSRRLRLPGARQERWVYNYLRNQWSTFVSSAIATSVTERDGRPWAMVTSDGGASFQVQAPTLLPAPMDQIGTTGIDAMSLTTGWLAMGRIQGFGRVWEVQLTGEQDVTSQSGLRVEIFYDYKDDPVETYRFNEPSDADGNIKIRFRPRRQKSEAISFRFTEIVPPATLPADCTGWRLDMCTVLAGVKAGLDKVAVTVRSS